MTLRPLCIALACMAGSGAPAMGQTVAVTPFVGYETSGSYPVENPTTVGAFRADAGKVYGTFVDYALPGDLQLELEWVHNPTTYSAQSTAGGQYREAFSSQIDQLQLGALYYLRDPSFAWRPYVAAGLGFTHDSNGGNNPGRTALGFGVGGGVTRNLAAHFGLRGDMRWMPTYGSEDANVLCDEFGDCSRTHHYLQRFTVVVGLIVRP
jgi:hypothetical protein